MGHTPSLFWSLQFANLLKVLQLLLKSLCIILCLPMSSHNRDACIEGHSFRFGFLAFFQWFSIQRPLNCFNVHSLNMSWMSFFNLLLLLPTCFLLSFNFHSSHSRIFMISWYVYSWTASSSAELFTSVSKSFANLHCRTWQDIGKNMKHGGDDESNVWAGGWAFKLFVLDRWTTVSVREVKANTLFII